MTSANRSSATSAGSAHGTGRAMLTGPMKPGMLPLARIRSQGSYRPLPGGTAAVLVDDDPAGDGVLGAGGEEGEPVGLVLERHVLAASTVRGSRRRRPGVGPVVGGDALPAGVDDPASAVRGRGAGASDAAAAAGATVAASTRRPRRREPAPRGQAGERPPRARSGAHHGLPVARHDQPVTSSTWPAATRRAASEKSNVPPSSGVCDDQVIDQVTVISPGQASPSTVRRVVRRGRTRRRPAARATARSSRRRRCPAPVQSMAARSVARVEGEARHGDELDADRPVAALGVDRVAPVAHGDEHGQLEDRRELARWAGDRERTGKRGGDLGPSVLGHLLGVVPRHGAGDDESWG